MPQASVVQVAIVRLEVVRVAVVANEAKRFDTHDSCSTCGFDCKSGGKIWRRWGLCQSSATSQFINGFCETGSQA